MSWRIEAVELAVLSSIDQQCIPDKIETRCVWYLFDEQGVKGGKMKKKMSLEAGHIERTLRLQY